MGFRVAEKGQQEKADDGKNGENQGVKVKVLFFGSGDMWVVRREGGARTGAQR